jgi:hypothetical protein
MRGVRVTHRRFVGIALAVMVIAPVAAIAQPAVAFPKGDSVILFAYKIRVSTHIKKLNQTITPPQGTFNGQIDLTQGRLAGSIALPPATFTMKLAGAVSVLTATARIVPTKPVSGTIDLSNFRVKATSTFNLRIVSAYAAGVPVNLVGDSCTTATPVSVTMSGTASLGGSSKFAGTFTIPQLKSCGLATTALNQVIPGPGNTFSAIATA